MKMTENNRIINLVIICFLIFNYYSIDLSVTSCAIEWEEGDDGWFASQHKGQNHASKSDFYHYDNIYFMEDYCSSSTINTTLTLSPIGPKSQLKLWASRTYYASNLDCLVNINLNPRHEGSDYGIMMIINRLKMRYNAGVEDNLKIKHWHKPDETRYFPGLYEIQKGINEYITVDHIDEKSKRRGISVGFNSDDDYNHRQLRVSTRGKGFEIIFTAFERANSETSIKSKQSAHKARENCAKGMDICSVREKGGNNMNICLWNGLTCPSRHDTKNIVSRKTPFFPPLNRTHGFWFGTKIVLSLLLLGLLLAVITCLCKSCGKRRVKRFRYCDIQSNGNYNVYHKFPGGIQRIDPGMVSSACPEITTKSPLLCTENHHNKKVRFADYGTNY